MNKKYIKTLLAALAWVGFSLFPAAGSAQVVPTMEEYQSTPFWLEGSSIPQVMLVLERDWKMSYPAYNNLASLDPDRETPNQLDIGFNPAVTYVGYFDPDSCYAYGTPASSAPGYAAAGGGNAGRFFRAGPTDKSEAAWTTQQGLFPTWLANEGVKPAKRSKHGYCDRNRNASSQDGGGTGANGGLWHGNWLNFSTTSRMDAIRRVLYGGKRSVDMANRTLLEMTPFIPPNAHNWGGELFADNVWPVYGKTSPWYDIPSFTAYARPAAGRMHFWARTTYYRATYSASSLTKSPDPLFQFAANIPASNWNSVYKTPLRFWDWVGDHGPAALPYDSHMVAGPVSTGNSGSIFPGACSLNPNRVYDPAKPCYDPIPGGPARSFSDFTGNFTNKPTNQAARRYIARVEACATWDPSNPSTSANEQCREYGGNQKPAGLLQDYGESGRMLFGLLTGSINADTRWRGGVVRHHIQNFSAYVETNGVFKRPGLMETMDRLQITGFGTSYTDGTAAGNPLGTMVYEAVRYMARQSSGRKTGLTPTAYYKPSAEITLPPYNSQTGTASQLPRLVDTWDAAAPNPARPYLGTADDSDCSKPVILILSEVIPDHDSDTYNYGTGSVTANDVKGSDNTTRNHRVNYSTTFPSASLPNLPLLRSMVGKVPAAFDVATYLQKITDHEGFKSVGGEPKFFYPDKPRGVCRPQDLPSTGLVNISGHCPSAPSLSGSFSLAAVAYYAHTHDVANLGGTPGSSGKAEKSVDFFAVGIPGLFTDVTISLSALGDNDKRSITIMPITVANDQGTVPFRTLINFYMTHWETDKNGIPIKMKFATNFEYTTNVPWNSGSGSNNHERDIFSKFEISLLTTAQTGSQFREDMPTFINSGVLKTCPYSINVLATNNFNNSSSSGTGFDPCMKNWYANKKSYMDKGTGYETAFTSKTEDFSPATMSFPSTYTPGRERYLYAFKNPISIDLDVTDHTIAGVAVQMDTHGSNINIAGHGGYSINGSTFDGVYLDAGFYGSGAPDSGTTPNGPSCASGTGVVANSATASGTAGTQADGCKAFENRQVLLTADYPDPNLHGQTSQRMRGLPPGHRNPTTPNDPLLTPWECPFPPPNDGRDITEVIGSLTPTERDKIVKAYCGSGLSYARTPADNCLSDAYLARACGQGSARAATTADPGGSPTSATSTTAWFPLHPLNRYFQVRGFEFNENPPTVKSLHNPMWLAAKYGGFRDDNGNGLPDPGEWERGGYGPDAGDPHNYYNVANLSQLPEKLDQAFKDIAKGIATGTANAASINTVLGGGLSIQTQYHTEYPDPKDPENKIGWLGSIYALFVDKWGNLRADTNGDHRLQIITSSADEVDKGGIEKGDLIVHTVPPAEGEIGDVTVYLCRDVYGNNNGGFFLPDNIHPDSSNPNDPYPPEADCQKVTAGMDGVRAVWNVGAELSRKAPADRKLYSYYGTCDDCLGDGAKPWPATERDVREYPFTFAAETPAAKRAELKRLMRQKSDQDATNLIGYVRGTDFPNKYRNRTTTLPWSGQTGVWRLGDVINSRPIIVGDPAGNYHLLYRDQSYDAYKTAQARRRQVVYVGSNDGILHAFNLGYFGSLKTGEAGYTRDPDDPDAQTGPDFGEELWGYVPTAVLPHLEWTADPNYRHSYYVDQQPYIMDVKDGDEWKTIMFVGLRMGGRTIMDETVSPPLLSYSEFFALDVTNPEETPKLLWRYSGRNLGLTTASPTVVRNGNNWYIVLPSGPTQDLPNGRPDPVNGPRAYDGQSNQKARLIVLNALTGQYARARDRDPSTATGADLLEVSEDNSFFNGAFLPAANNVNKQANGSTESWSHHVVYLGLTALEGGDDTGSVYRLQMADANGNPLPVDSWRLARFYKADKPITGAVNSTWDNVGNLWVVFGSGRIWSNKDQSPCGPGAGFEHCCDNHDQYFFGLKEPLNDDGRLTFAEVGSTADKPIVDVSGVLVFGTSGILDPGITLGGEEVFAYNDLYLKMIAKDNTGAPLVRGYKRKMENWRVLGDSNPGNTRFEIVTTQAQIDSLGNGRSNTVFSSYLTNDNLCDPIGDSYLNVIDTYTGLPHPDFLGYGGFAEGEARSIGPGGATGGPLQEQSTGVKRSGKGVSSEAWILKTGEGTVYGNTSFNSQRNRIFLPVDQSDRSAIVSWREVLDMGFTLESADLYSGL